jgi:2-phospho-L-lactate guanylyltransferase
VNIWAVIPVKPLNRSKSRLAPILDGEQRESLSREILEKTLATLKTVEQISGILVVSRDTAALSLARRFDVHTVQESGAPELNDALTRATNAVASWNARGVLIVASDIPLLRVEDIEAMLELAKLPPVVVIAADRRQDGTNVLLVRPPGLIPYRYGEGSFQKHIDEAKAAGVDVHIYESPTVALDVDVPEDLDLYRDMLIERALSQPGWLVRAKSPTLPRENLPAD